MGTSERRAPAGARLNPLSPGDAQDCIVGGEIDLETCSLSKSFSAKIQAADGPAGNYGNFRKNPPLGDYSIL